MTIKADTWLYVVVQKKGVHEQIVGQTDTEHDLSYIPAFKEKEEAQQAMLHLQLEKKSKYEVQAIISEDLADHAKEDGFLIFVLDEEGTIIEQLSASS